MDAEKFEIFKEVFAEIAQNQFKACNSFINELDKCDNAIKIEQLMFKYGDEIAEKLDSYSDDVNQLEIEVSQLEDECENLVRELQEVKEPLGDTLYDEMKFQTFLKYSHKFTPWELEEILSK